MREDIAKKWVEALRSGKYKQGMGTLHNTYDNTYCCLGVLQGPVLDLPIGNSACGLTVEARELSGIKDELGAFQTTTINPLFYLNDSEHNSFDEIADVIEANWKDL